MRRYQKMRFNFLIIGLVCFLCNFSKAEVSFRLSPVRLVSFELDSIPKKTKFIPVPKKSALYGLIPGGGQIYNRHYWKLPLVYGGFVAGNYFINLSTEQYNRFRGAYLLYEETEDAAMVTEQYDIPESFVSAEALQSRRIKWDKNRQQSYIFTSIFYLVTILEAYTSAHLTDFDISDDLSLRFQPFQENTPTYYSGLTSNLGLSLVVYHKTASQKTIQPQSFFEK